MNDLSQEVCHQRGGDGYIITDRNGPISKMPSTQGSSGRIDGFVIKNFTFVRLILNLSKNVQNSKKNCRYNGSYLKQVDIEMDPPT